MPSAIRQGYGFFRLGNDCALPNVSAPPGSRNDTHRAPIRSLSPAPMLANHFTFTFIVLHNVIPKVLVKNYDRNY